MSCGVDVSSTAPYHIVSPDPSSTNQFEAGSGQRPFEAIKTAGHADPFTQAMLYGAEDGTGCLC